MVPSVQANRLRPRSWARDTWLSAWGWRRCVVMLYNTEDVYEGVDGRVTTGSSSVATENAKPGSLAWLPQRLRFVPTGVRGEFLGADFVSWLDSGRGVRVEGWCSESSIAAGEA